MGIIDILIIVALIIGAFLGYRRGIFKELNDLVVLFISSLIAGELSKILFNITYKFLPFFNFLGKSKGIKSINIILWQLILYVIILLIIIFVIKKVYTKTKIEEKIKDSMVETNLITKLLGFVISPLLMTVLLFNLFLIFLTPNFNLKIINDSKGAKMIMEKLPLLSVQNKVLYENQTYTINRLNKKDNNDKNYKKINDDITGNMIKTKLISKEKVNILNKNNKLLGKRKTTMDKIIDETDVTSPNW